MSGALFQPAPPTASRPAPTPPPPAPPSGITVRVTADAKPLPLIHIERVCEGEYLAIQNAVSAEVKLDPLTSDSDPQWVAAHCLFALVGAKLGEARP